MTVQFNLASSSSQTTYEQKIKTTKTCNFEGCTKSLKFVDQALKCRCEGVYCRKHRDVIAHHCKIQSLLSPAARKSKHVFERSVRDGSAF